MSTLSPCALKEARASAAKIGAEPDQVGHRIRIVSAARAAGAAAAHRIANPRTRAAAGAWFMGVPQKVASSDPLAGVGAPAGPTGAQQEDRGEGGADHQQRDA